MLDRTGPLTETRRKLELLARRYLDLPRTRYLPEAIRQQHRSMFGLTIFEDFGVNPQSTERSRSGLIVTESLMGLLNFEEVKDFTPDRLRQIVEEGAASEWAPHVYAEWKMVSPERMPGRWWPMPVLYALLPQHPASTIRTVLIGLEAMEVVLKRRTTFRADPKSRTKAVALTKEGEALFEKLAKKLAK
jgi:hypothetical protein